MTLNTYIAFMAVVEEMSFSKAAQRLYVTQQSLSGQIRRLEEEFGVTLFERRPVLKLTPEGESMLFYAQQILQTQDAMVNDFADLSKERKAYLDVGISYMRSVMFSSGIWERFNEQYGNIVVRLHEYNTNTLVEKLQQGEIAMMIGVDVPSAPGTRILPLMEEHPCCIVRRDLYRQYIAGKEEVSLQGSRNEEISVNSLSEVPLLFLSRGNRLRLSLDTLFRNAGVRPRILFESQRQDVLYQLACDGKGAAILSPMMLYDRKGGGMCFPEDCLVLRIRETSPNVVSLVTMERAHQTGYEEAMIGIIREVFSEYDDAIAACGLRRLETLFL